MEIMIVMWCIVQDFHHDDGSGETSVDKTMYMKSIIKCYCIPFVLHLPVPMICLFSPHGVALNAPSSQSAPKICGGWNRELLL